MDAMILFFSKSKRPFGLSLEKGGLKPRFNLSEIEKNLKKNFLEGIEYIDYYCGFGRNEFSND